MADCTIKVKHVVPDITINVNVNEVPVDVTSVVSGEINKIVSGMIENTGQIALGDITHAGAINTSGTQTVKGSVETDGEHTVSGNIDVDGEIKCKCKDDDDDD